MTYRFSRTSEDRLKNLHPDLVRVIRRAMSWQIIDFTVVETLRTPEQQAKNLKKGVSKTMKSLHLPDTTGKARAIDVAPYPINWKDTGKFKMLAGIILAASREEDVHLRWGGSWDGTMRSSSNRFNDYPHFELHP